MYPIDHTATSSDYSSVKSQHALDACARRNTCTNLAAEWPLGTLQKTHTENHSSYHNSGLPSIQKLMFGSIDSPARALFRHGLGLDRLGPHKKCSRRRTSPSRRIVANRTVRFPGRGISCSQTVARGRERPALQFSDVKRQPVPGPRAVEEPAVAVAACGAFGRSLSSNAARPARRWRRCGCGAGARLVRETAGASFPPLSARAARSRAARPPPPHPPSSVQQAGAPPPPPPLSLIHI